MSDSKFSLRVAFIVKSCKGNLNFPNQQASVADLESKNKAFDLAMKNVNNGPAGSAAIKNGIRVEIVQMMKTLAINCAAEVNDDLIKFLTSGFTAREHHTITALNTPTDLKLTPGENETELNLDFKGDEKATFYKVWIGLDTESSLRIETPTSAHFTIKGLTPGVRYYIRVAACGAKELMSGWSSFASRIAS